MRDRKRSAKLTVCMGNALLYRSNDGRLIERLMYTRAYRRQCLAHSPGIRLLGQPNLQHIVARSRDHAYGQIAVDFTELHLQPFPRTIQILAAQRLSRPVLRETPTHQDHSGE
jgi:hypothetical protein